MKGRSGTVWECEQFISLAEEGDGVEVGKPFNVKNFEFLKFRKEFETFAEIVWGETPQRRHPNRHQL